MRNGQKALSIEKRFCSEIHETANCLSWNIQLVSFGNKMMEMNEQNQDQSPENNQKSDINIASTIFDESDDDEPVRGPDYDFSSSYTFRKTQFAEEEEPFRFYEFGTPPVSFQDLLRSIKTMKQVTGGTSPKKRTTTIKTFDIKAYQKTIDLQKSLPTSYKQYRISHFHPTTPKWDGSHMPDPILVKDLYRIPCRDPTGKVIFSLMRDETKLTPDQQAWKPPEHAKDLPEPPCSFTFQLQAISHLDATIEKVEAEYKKMPQQTQAQSVLKAQVGADLNNLKLDREKLKKQLESNPVFLEQAKKELGGLSPTKKGSHSHSP